MKYEKSKVVMLPTEKASKNGIAIGGINKELIFLNTDNSVYNCNREDFNWEPQHLYFLSDEVPKVGDWVYDWFNNQIKKYEEVGSGTKIIATTDSSLMKQELLGKNTHGGFFISDSYLPRPSNEFLKKYCELGGIDEVLVEYENDNRPNNEYGWPMKLKIAPDNTITIKPIKDSWSRKEVTSLIHKAIYELTMPDGEPEFVEGYEINNWIKKNL